MRPRARRAAPTAHPHLFDRAQRPDTDLLNPDPARLRQRILHLRGLEVVKVGREDDDRLLGDLEEGFPSHHRAHEVVFEGVLQVLEDVFVRFVVCLLARVIHVPLLYCGLELDRRCIVSGLT